MTNTPLADRKVLVTGASSGIGEATAYHLSSLGADVALLARRVDRLEDSARAIKARGGLAVAVECDLASATSVRSAVDRSVESLGALHACVLAAGVASFAPLDQTTDEDFEGQLTANLRGPFWLLRAAIPKIEDGGTIVLVLSVAADKGFPGCTVYGATKAGLQAMGLALREELRSRRIRVALVTPGATDTPLWDTLGADFDRESMLAADDVAHAVASVLTQSDRSAIEAITLRPVGGDF